MYNSECVGHLAQRLLRLAGILLDWFVSYRQVDARIVVTREMQLR